MNNSAEEFAKLFDKKEDLHKDLKPYVFKSKSLGYLLQHPLHYQVPYHEQLNVIINAQYVHKKKFAMDALKRKDHIAFIGIHEKPHRFNAFISVKNKMNDVMYWEMLGELIIGTENFWQWKDKFHEILEERSGSWQMMTESEKSFLLNSQSKLTIYRGCSNNNKQGWSWSLDKDMAIWFANRYNSRDRILITGECDKSMVVAFFNGRNEHEILINPKNVNVINRKVL